MSEMIGPVECRSFDVKCNWVFQYLYVSSLENSEVRNNVTFYLLESSATITAD